MPSEKLRISGNVAMPSHSSGPPEGRYSHRKKAHSQSGTSRVLR